MKKDNIIKIILDNKNKQLHELDLSSIEIDVIPKEVFSLTHLKILRIENSNISSIPKDIKYLKNLEYLYLRGNKLKELPKEIASLEKLKSIDVRDNPVINPPIEIVNRGINVIRNYFQEIQKQDEVENLYEAKLLIVGDGGVGKTSLARKLMDFKSSLPSFEETTRGIDITPLKFPIGRDNTFKANIWDFGGQEIYHSTHQFFLSKRSLYVMVIDARNEIINFDYWLQVIEVLSSSSPVIIVQNEKQDRKKQINILGLKERFPNIHSVLSTNLMTNRGLPAVIDTIKHEIVKLPHVGSVLPKVWEDIRNELDSLSNKLPYISLNQYVEICKNYGVDDNKRALFLSEFYHDLGVFLHFQDSPVLKHILILRPEWGTEAVYKVLDNSKVIDNYGIFDIEDVKAIWTSPRYYGMHDELLELMKRFELCYQIEGGNEFIAPQLLTAEKPEYSFKYNNPLSLKFKYDFLPKGIISRFIVRMNRYIQNHSLIWNEGVILERNSAAAEIIQYYTKRIIEINIVGEPISRKELMILVIEEFDKIHDSFPKLDLEKLIPCVCEECVHSSNPDFYEYSTLQRYIDKGKSTIECRKSFISVPVKKLIGDFDPSILPDSDDVERTLSKIKSNLKSSFITPKTEGNE